MSCWWFLTIHIKHQHVQVTKTYAVFISKSLKPQNITSSQINQIKQQKTWHLTLPKTNIAHQTWAFCHPRTFTQIPPKMATFLKPEFTFSKTIILGIQPFVFGDVYIIAWIPPTKMGNASFPLVETYGTFFSFLGASLRASQDFIHPCPVDRWKFLRIVPFDLVDVCYLSHGRVKSLNVPCFGRKRTGWWFQRFFMFTPIPGEDEAILTNIFSMGWFNHQLGDRFGPFPCWSLMVFNCLAT